MWYTISSTIYRKFSAYQNLFAMRMLKKKNQNCPRSCCTRKSDCGKSYLQMLEYLTDIFWKLASRKRCYFTYIY